MIKNFSQFINESHVPGPDELGSSRINLTDEEVEWFSSEPALQKLISDNKVALLPPELWYTADDRNTINTLEDFFPDAEFDMEDEEDYKEEQSDGFDEENESMINESESLIVKKKILMSRLAEIGRERKKLDKEYDDLIKDIHKVEDEMDKPEKNKKKK